MNGNPGTFTVWWVPDCGYIHCETDPPMTAVVCQDRGARLAGGETSAGQPEREET